MINDFLRVINEYSFSIFTIFKFFPVIIQSIGCVMFRTQAGVGTNKKIKIDDTNTLGSAKMSNLFNSTSDTSYKVGAINPELAKLFLSHGIIDMEMKSFVNSDRAGLCDDVIQLLKSSSKQTDREMASDILIGLLRHAEKNLKKAIAERFASFDEAPLRVILEFINDDIDVATPVLRYNKALNDLDLLYIIQSRDSPFWQVIASRESLAENVVESLVETKDIYTSKNLIDNETVKFSDYAAEQIANLAKENSILTEALINRSMDKEGDFARQIYTYASESLKLAIVEKCGRLSNDAAQKLEEVLEEFTDGSNHNFMPTASMIKAAEFFQEQGKLNPSLMLNTLKRGQMASFIAQFSRFVSLPIAVVVPMLQQKNGQGLSIAAKANGITRNDFLMIFNFTRKILGEDFLSAKDVTIALAYYDRVSPDVAKRLMRQRQN
jgi:uncharacterized protein (DUF2336 family)